MESAADYTAAHEKAIAVLESSDRISGTLADVTSALESRVAACRQANGHSSVTFGAGDFFCFRDGAKVATVSFLWNQFDGLHLWSYSSLWLADQIVTDFVADRFVERFGDCELVEYRDSDDLPKGSGFWADFAEAGSPVGEYPFI